MSKTIKSAMKRTTLLVALVFVCSMVSSSALAQSRPERPLNEEGVSALIDELKGGLADLIDDEDQVAAITEKWDAHENLVGRTKTQILAILFADVKSVVADRETQNSIWTSWASVGNSEDESVAEGPPAPAPAAAPAPPPANPPAQVIDPGTCSPRKASLFVQPNQAERFGLVRVGYRRWFATGTVICFKEEKGYGYIARDDGGPDLFVHFTSINMNGFKTLKEGQKVQFEICQPTKPNAPPAACNVRAA